MLDEVILTLRRCRWGAPCRPLPVHLGVHYKDRPDRNVAIIHRALHNAGVSISTVVLDFLQRIAIGAGAVFAVLLIIRLGLPKRAGTAVTRRTLN